MKYSQPTPEYSALIKILDYSPDGVVVDQRGVVLFTNPEADSLFNQPRLALLGELFGFPLGQDRVQEIKILSTEGAPRIAELRVVTLEWEGKPALLIALRDITEHKHLQQSLIKLAQHDMLTQLPNRFRLAELLPQAMLRAERNNSLLGVMMLDLDHFKPINDTFGHAVGDQVLIEASRRIKQHLRQTDTLARIGGDEFVIVLEDVTSTDKSAEVARRIIDDLSKPLQIDGHTPVIGCSIGITFFPMNTQDQDKLLCNADAAMYQAKQLGRNRYHFFTQAMGDAAQQQAIQGSCSITPLKQTSSTCSINRLYRATRRRSSALRHCCDGNTQSTVKPLPLISLTLWKIAD